MGVLGPGWTRGSRAPWPCGLRPEHYTARDGYPSKKGRPKAPLKSSHGRTDYGQAVQVVGPVTTQGAPPVTVNEYVFFTNSVVASKPNAVGVIRRIWYTTG